jgi:hypothetical protein
VLKIRLFTMHIAKLSGESSAMRPDNLSAVRERLTRRPLLLLLAVGYVAGLFTITTTPVFLDEWTASRVAIGPLLFEILLAAYLIVRYLGLRGFLLLVAYFLAFVGLVSVPSGILLPTGLGQHYPTGANNSNNLITTNSTTRWLNNFDIDCVLAHGESSAHDSTGYYPLGYAGAGSRLSTNCHGIGTLASEAYSSGLFGRASIQSSVWFMDRQFYVPKAGQQSSQVYVGGTIHVGGWLADHNAGIGIYNSGTGLELDVKITGTAPCDLYNCYGSGYQARSWSGSQTMSNDYQFSGLIFPVAPGYYYNIIVSFNETSSIFGAGAGGIVSSEACFGYSAYCTSTDAGSPLTCSPKPSSYPECGVIIKDLSYTLTNF